MPLAEPADIVNWIGKDIEATRQDELVQCIAFAQSWIAQQAGLRSLEKEAAAVTEYIDGELAPNPEEVWLSNACRPAWHSGTTDALTVSENGASQSVAVGYSTTASIVLSGVNRFERVRLASAGAWSPFGKQNIAVTLKCGFDPDVSASINPQPYSVKRLVMEVAWLTFTAPSRAGKASVSKAGQTVSLLDELSPAGRDTLNWLRGA